MLKTALHPSDGMASSAPSEEQPVKSAKPTTTDPYASTGTAIPQPLSFAPRKKQYLALQKYRLRGAGRWKNGDLVLLTNEQAVSLVAGGILMPLVPAINAGLYPPKKPEEKKKKLPKSKLAAKVQAKKLSSAKTEPAATETAAVEEKPAQPEKKRFLFSRLRQKVQAKKEAGAKRWT